MHSANAYLRAVTSGTIRHDPPARDDRCAGAGGRTPVA